MPMASFNNKLSIQVIFVNLRILLWKFTHFLKVPGSVPLVVDASRNTKYREKLLNGKKMESPVAISISCNEAGKLLRA